jgi:hypothetical protein
MGLSAVCLGLSDKCGHGANIVMDSVVYTVF